MASQSMNIASNIPSHTQAEMRGKIQYESNHILRIMEGWMED
jgi:hypothetical protein